MRRVALGLRAAAFYVAYVSFTAIWATLSVMLTWPLPLKGRYDFIIGRWTRVALWLLKACCGIRAQVTGLSRIPDEPCIFLVKHQSTWETLWTQTLVSPQAPLIKRELLRIPMWGWAFAMAHPIAIDRDNPRTALKQFIAEGRDRLERGMYITLFPEGTRLEPGADGRFYRGGAALAAATGVPVVVIAHNAGRHWPARRFLKHPGEIAVEISEPFPTKGKKSSDINSLCEEWMRDAMRRLEAD